MISTRRFHVTIVVVYNVALHLPFSSNFTDRNESIFIGTGVSRTYYTDFDIDGLDLGSSFLLLGIPFSITRREINWNQFLNAFTKVVDSKQNLLFLSFFFISISLGSILDPGGYLGRR